MKKKQVIEALIATLEADFRMAESASREAADYATHEEAKADSKWDTQGLEASYLAAGQASQARELAETLQIFRTALDELQPLQSVQSGSLVSIQYPDTVHWFYFANRGGGVNCQIGSEQVTVVTPGSPVGQQLLGKKSGSSWKLPNGSEATLLEVH